jgi:anaerobic magnesium-protoporphyrin IX monomethyl ester cyclase
MRILFIHPNIDLPGYKLVGVSILSALARAAGHVTELFDTSFIETKQLSKVKYWEDKNSVLARNLVLRDAPVIHSHQKEKVDLRKALHAKLAEFKPDVVGVSALSTEWGIAQLILDYSKAYSDSIFTVVGGRHCVADPEGTIGHPSVDAVCIGEGEVPFMRLLEALDRGGMDYKIPGMWIKRPEGSVEKTPLPPYLMNHELDALPWLDNEIYDEGQFLRLFFGKVYRSLDFNLMRGCTEFCNYCQMAKVYELHGGDRTVRRYSPGRAIEEMAWQKDQWNLDFIRFHDESFLIVSNIYLAQLAKEYQQHVDLPFVADASPLTVTPERARLIKEMGCVSMSLGFESGNEAFRRGDLNKNVTNKRALKSFHSLADVGIRSVSFNMIGFPHETRGVIFDSIEFMREARVHSPSINFVYPFKGTALRDQAINAGLFDPAIEEHGVAQWTVGRPFISNPKISLEEYQGIFSTFLLYCKMPKKYWNDIKVAERSDPQGEKMLERLTDVYNEDFQAISCGASESSRYVPGIAASS